MAETRSADVLAALGAALAAITPAYRITAGLRPLEQCSEREILWIPMQRRSQDASTDTVERVLSVLIVVTAALSGSAPYAGVANNLDAVQAAIHSAAALAIGGPLGLTRRSDQNVEFLYDESGGAGSPAGAMFEVELGWRETRSG